MNAYYLLVWMEDSGCWWTADECEERSRRGAVAMLRGRNPRQCRPGRPWAVVGLDEWARPWGGSRWWKHTACWRRLRQRSRSLVAGTLPDVPA